MDCTGEFTGRMVINGQVEADSVSVFLSEDSLALGPGGMWRLRRKKLYLSPFNRCMLLTQDPEKVAGGFFYEISRTRVGSFQEGPLGHPGDGEFDERPLRAFRLDVRYQADGIMATLTGRTAPGCRPLADAGALESLAFEIGFLVPRAGLQAFFQLSDEVRDRLEKMLGPRLLG